MERVPRHHIFGSVLGLLLIVGARSHAAFERQPWGGAATSTGGSHIIVWEDPWATLEHPVSICLHPAPVISAAVHPGAFGLVELRRSGIVLVLPQPWGGVAAGATVYGFELYREVTVAAGAAMPVTAAIGLGAVLRWQHLVIAGHGSVVALSLDAGLRLRLTEGLAATATLGALASTPLSRDGERPGQELRLGLTGRLGGGLKAGIEWAGNRWYPLGLAAGVEYRVLSPLALRCGASTEPREYTAGLGLRLGGVSLDYGLVLHAVLGATHALSIGFSLA